MARALLEGLVALEDLQLLCLDCNRWKDNGPCCPCPYWDTMSPEWRDTDDREAD